MTSTTVATCSSVGMAPIKLINKHLNNISHTMVVFVRYSWLFVEESDVVSREYWTVVTTLSLISDLNVCLIMKAKR